MEPLAGEILDQYLDAARAAGIADVQAVESLVGFVLRFAKGVMPAPMLQRAIDAALREPKYKVTWALPVLPDLGELAERQLADPAFWCGLQSELHWQAGHWVRLSGKSPEVAVNLAIEAILRSYQGRPEDIQARIYDHLLSLRQQTMFAIAGKKDEKLKACVSDSHG
ncbi:MAG: hypothetical protein FD176_2241 [Rhodospirillaceae bacterium]|nr:MAG: hypothetical protein FD176_2241 [Rhodospirillaceae bacterium]TNC95814.1 MAG: hypothetical protein FD119_2189 [Stygiobacter sp.]